MHRSRGTHRLTLALTQTYNDDMEHQVLTLLTLSMWHIFFLAKQDWRQFSLRLYICLAHDFFTYLFYGLVQALFMTDVLGYL